MITLFPEAQKPRERRDLDRYYTTDRLAADVVAWLAIPPHATVIESHVGGGAFVRALRRSGHRGRIIGCDLDPDAAGLALCDEAHVGDWLTVGATLTADIVIGNPPFADGLAHVPPALAAAPRVAFLLPQTKREHTVLNASIWPTHPLYAHLTLGRRESFVGGDKLQALIDIMVWRRGHVGPALSEIVDQAGGIRSAITPFAWT